MAYEDNDVVSQAEFAEVRTTVNHIKEGMGTLASQVNQQNNMLNQLSTSLQSLSSIKDILEQKLNSAEPAAMWEKINNNKTDIDNAHAGLRSTKENFRNITILAAFFFGIIQGLIYWWVDGFATRADQDHDLLMQTIINLETLSEDYYYEKRRNLPPQYQPPRDSRYFIPEEFPWVQQTEAVRKDSGNPLAGQRNKY